MKTILLVLALLMSFRLGGLVYRLMITCYPRVERRSFSDDLFSVAISAVAVILFLWMAQA